MECEPRAIRLNQLNLPAEGLRPGYSPAGRKRLKESIERHGILSAVLVRKIGGREFEVVDGATRVEILRELGKPANFLVPANVFEGEDAKAVVAGLVVNQVRERFAELGELRALRDLISAHGLTQQAAALELGKTQGWASQMMSVLSLPASIQRHVEKGELAVSHAVVIARFSDRPEIRDLLLDQALKGDASGKALRRMGEAAEQSGLRAAKRAKPRTIRLGTASWIRIEPVRDAVRAEVHWNRKDSPRELLKQLQELLGSVPEIATPPPGTASESTRS